jgi:hypothetical protein
MEMCPTFHHNLKYGIGGKTLYLVIPDLNRVNHSQVIKVSYPEENNSECLICSGYLLEFKRFEKNKPPLPHILLSTQQIDPTEGMHEK